MIFLRQYALVMLAAATLASVGACAEPKAVLYRQNSTLTAEDYQGVLETWTRSDKVYKRLDNIIFVTATYHSPELRRAFALAFPDIYGHGGDVTRRELVDLTGDVEQFHTFFLTAFTPDRKWNDLEKVDSIWHMTLAGSGSAVNPHTIELVNIDENLRTVYPHIDRFDKAYLVRFPLIDTSEELLIGPETKSFTLRIASALGVAQPTWNLAKK